MNLQHLILGAALISLIIAPAIHSKDFGKGRENLAPSLLLQNLDGQNDQWRGIGRLVLNAKSPDAYCTASLIDTRDGDSDLSAPAYVLTSGHCLSFDTLNVKTNEPGDGYIDFNYFSDAPQNHHRYAVKEVKWSRLRGLDMAIVELDASLETLVQDGIQPLKLATSAPAIGTQLLIVGAPSQYPENGLRLSTCTHVGTETLLEQPAVHRGFYKDHCLGLKPGSSGSPLLDRYSNEVLAVISTSTAGALAQTRCFENAPCELKNGQPHWSPNTNYASPTSFLQHCFVKGQFTPATSRCDLMPSVYLSQKRPSVNYYRRVEQDAKGHQVLPTWNFAFTLDQPFYRYKTVRDPQLCESPHHYSQALGATDALISDPVGPEPGIYLLCIIGVDSAEHSPTWPMMKSPLVLAMEVAEPGPTRAPQFDINPQEDGGFTIAWYFSHPSLSAYEYKAGAAHQTQCEEPQDYEHTFDDVHIYASDLPVKLCTKSFDMSGQRSLPREDLIRN